MISPLETLIAVTLTFASQTSVQAWSCTGECQHGLSTKYLNYTSLEQERQPCICQDGYNGRYCETPEFKCLNGGTALSNGRCKCPSDREGTRCESLRCYNGIPAGEIRWKLDDSSPCICDVGYTGRQCEQHMTSQCGSHGKLLVGRENEGCQCDAAYTGINCEHLKDCINGIDEGGRCDCEDGWTGHRCDQIVCVYGAAVNNRSECHCENGFIGGKHCDVCTDFFEEPPFCGQKERNKEKWFLISISVAATLVVLLALVLLLLCLRKPQATRQFYTRLRKIRPQKEKTTRAELVKKIHSLQAKLNELERKQSRQSAVDIYENPLSE